jgi:hypothetical protein
MVNLLSKIPLGWVKVIVMFLFLVLIIWAWLIPKEYIFSESPDRKVWRDLRIWTTIAVITEAFIYLIF